MFEGRPGQALAQNMAIAVTTGDLVGFDDDERVDRNWFLRVYSAFKNDLSLDFIGGPYLPYPAGKKRDCAMLLSSTLLFVGD